MTKTQASGTACSRPGAAPPPHSHKHRLEPYLVGMFVSNILESGCIYMSALARPHLHASTQRHAHVRKETHTDTPRVTQKNGQTAGISTAKPCTQRRTLAQSRAVIACSAGWGCAGGRSHWRSSCTRPRPPSCRRSRAAAVWRPSVWCPCGRAWPPPPGCAAVRPGAAKYGGAGGSESSSCCALARARAEGTQGQEQRMCLSNCVLAQASACTQPAKPHSQPHTARHTHRSGACSSPSSAPKHTLTIRLSLQAIYTCLDDSCQYTHTHQDPCTPAPARLHAAALAASRTRTHTRNAHAAADAHAPARPPSRRAR